jgi:type III secretion protein J
MGDIFKKEGFVSSPLEERARYLYALSQELAQTLSLIDGVVSARVHVALPEHRPLDDAPRSASAAVAIIQEPDVDLSPLEIDIKAIITDGVEGLDDVNRVTVKFFTRRSQPGKAL